MSRDTIITTVEGLFMLAGLFATISTGELRYGLGSMGLVLIERFAVDAWSKRHMH